MADQEPSPSKELALPPVVPLRRHEFRYHVTTEEFGYMWWKKVDKKVESVVRQEARSTVDTMHDLVTNVREKCPVEAYCFVGWCSPTVPSIIQNLMTEDYLETLDALCPRHHHDPNNRHLKAPNDAGQAECSVVSLIKTIYQLKSSWYVPDSVTKKVGPSVRPPAGLSNKCTMDQLDPLLTFISTCWSHCSDLVDAKNARIYIQKQKKRASVASPPQEDVAQDGLQGPPKNKTPRVEELTAPHENGIQVATNGHKDS